MEDLRTKLIEQKVEVLQREINEVLGETLKSVQDTQVTMQAMGKTFSAALEDIFQRVAQLEAARQAELRKDETGKEL